MWVEYRPRVALIDEDSFTTKVQIQGPTGGLASTLHACEVGSAFPIYRQGSSRCPSEAHTAGQSSRGNVSCVSGPKAPPFPCRLSQTLKRSHAYPLRSFGFRLYKNHIDFCFLNLCARGVRRDHKQLLHKRIRKERVLGSSAITPEKSDN